MTKKTELTPIELNNHERLLLRRIAKFIKRGEIDRKAIIEKEDAEDAPFRRKIVK